MNHLEKAARFKALHFRPGTFVMANAWDAGSAKLLEMIGFDALATTSAGMAFSKAKPDIAGIVSRSETLHNAQEILDCTSLPVSGDFFNGFADSPKDCAETYRLAASIGLSGASIEDATGNTRQPIYDLHLAVERVRAAVAAIKTFNQPFMLTARAENYLHGQPNLHDTIDRLRAYGEAGADVLFAPGLRTLDEIETLVKAVSPKPVNVLLNMEQQPFALKALEDIGVKRVSLGSGLFRLTYGYLQQMARDYLPRDKQDRFAPLIQYQEFNELFLTARMPDK